MYSRKISLYLRIMSNVIASSFRGNMLCAQMAGLFFLATLKSTYNWHFHLNIYIRVFHCGPPLLLWRPASAPAAWTTGPLLFELVLADHEERPRISWVGLLGRAFWVWLLPPPSGTHRHLGTCHGCRATWLWQCASPASCSLDSPIPFSRLWTTVLLFFPSKHCWQTQKSKIIWRKWLVS